MPERMQRASFAASPVHPPRRQLSLYVPEASAAAIEAVRRVVDPVQSRLIPAHVTLCREDELAQVVDADLVARLTDVRGGPFTLRFGPPRLFSGHGMLLDCLDGESQFVALRAHLLGTADIRRLKPHITLAHPRNAKDAGASLADAACLSRGIAIEFDAIRSIEQEGGLAWHAKAIFAL